MKAKNFLVATGSYPVQSPLSDFDGDLVLSPPQALTLSEIPKSICVLSSTQHMLEIASIFSRLGSEVTIIEK